MQLVTPTTEHLKQMMTWFNTQHEVFQWAGPHFRYPYDVATFTEDLALQRLASFALVSDKYELLGFGQYYPRLEKCHLGRIVVNPSWRGKGISKTLVELLNACGLKQLCLQQSSLFVLKDNQAAINSYLKLGFVESTYPESIPIDHCLYMIRAAK
ncbi:GCN5-like N-acetyltransferase [Shewanella piezotolerans WP3]|uniref:GCN5-like N-acetyltransferase n=1 Tax=Shewanella piezotolerans (strain WP3 / JCM 13877) TaxID=225849 RepID=B8CP50_SHEPW|nr:GNAT family N-acetyltransferase [Shewanella piezotolerans]ACJ29294.1 GCN5-like N-acetyltransferase [Shewanella piezotolerans WP3]